MIDVLIPTYCRKTGLAITLASLFGQTYREFSIAIADQTPHEEHYIDSIEIDTLIRAFRRRGVAVQAYERPVRRGLAEQCDPLAREVRRAIEDCDVLVISDYALGCVREETLEPLARKKQSMPVVLDARDLSNAARVRATVVTPNLEEACAATGNAVRTLAAPTEFEKLARAVRRRRLVHRRRCLRACRRL